MLHKRTAHIQVTQIDQKTNGVLFAHFDPGQVTATWKKKTNGATDLFWSVVEVGLDSLHQLGKRGLVFRVDVGQRQTRGRLPVHHTSQASLALHNGVGHSHLAAQGRQEQHDLKTWHQVSHFIYKGDGWVSILQLCTFLSPLWFFPHRNLGWISTGERKTCCDSVPAYPPYSRGRGRKLSCSTHPQPLFLTSVSKWHMLLSSEEGNGKRGRNLVFNAQTTKGPVCIHHHDPILSHCFPRQGLSNKQHTKWPIFPSGYGCSDLKSSIKQTSRLFQILGSSQQPTSPLTNKEKDHCKEVT